MRGAWVLPSLLFVAGVWACTSTTNGFSYGATYCPSEGVAGASCASCVESYCASAVAAFNGACSNASIGCACPVNVDTSKCNLATACENAMAAWGTCVKSACSIECGGTYNNSDAGTSGSGACALNASCACGQPAGGCAAGEVSGMRLQGCCATSSCASGTGTLASCADSCGNTWYETNGSLYGPCASGDSTCLQTTATDAVDNCR